MRNYKTWAKLRAQSWERRTWSGTEDYGEVGVWEGGLESPGDVWRDLRDLLKGQGALIGHRALSPEETKPHSRAA